LSDFLFDFYRSLADHGFAKDIELSMGILGFFEKPYDQYLNTAIRKKSLNSGFNFINSAVFNLNTICGDFKFVIKMQELMVS